MSNVQRIKELAKERGIRMGYIYEKLGCSRSKFTDVENGKSSISENEYSIIADLLNTTPEYLKGETDIKEKPATETGDGRNKELLDLFEQLTEEQRQMLIRQIKGILSDE